MRKKYVSKYRFYLPVLLFIFILTVTGCATSQKVNLDVLEACKAKQFKLGVVKAAGVGIMGIVGSAYVSEKKKALSKIPIEEICSTLNNTYFLKIDTNVDRTPKIVKERYGNNGMPPSHAAKPGLSLSINLQPETENAYYGNLEYDNASTIWLMLGGNSKINNENQVPDVVNVTYALEHIAFGFKLRFHYAINVKSSGKDVLSLKGIVETISTPKNGLIIDEAGVWKEYVKYAAHINDALKRDLKEAVQES